MGRNSRGLYDADDDAQYQPRDEVPQKGHPVSARVCAVAEVDIVFPHIDKLFEHFHNDSPPEF